jgi:polyisoprenoid-binding protein YceI
MSLLRPLRHAGLAFAGLLLALPVCAADYVQAPGSTLTFATKYQGEVFVGKMPEFSTRLSFDPRQLDASRLDVTIPLAGASIDNPEGTETLKGPSFFDVPKFPNARFVATKFRSLGGNRYAADGALTLRGVTRPVTLAFTWKTGAKPVLTGAATVRRLDFDVGGGEWADTGLIPDEVAVSTKVVLVPAK